LSVFFRCLATATFAEENAGRAYQYPSTGKIPGHFKADWETSAVRYESRADIITFIPAKNAYCKFCARDYNVLTLHKKMQ
jgi:hypothetical protein